MDCQFFNEQYTYNRLFRREQLTGAFCTELRKSKNIDFVLQNVGFGFIARCEKKEKKK